MKFCVLASGSGGNATWIQDGREAVLIDNGLSAAELMARAKSRGLDLNCLKAVAITHEHSDHIKGVGPLARRLDLTVWATEPTAKAAANVVKNVRLKTFEAGDDIKFKSLTLTSLPVSHDAANPVAFVAKGQSSQLGLVTDLGVVTHLVRDGCQSLSALVVEFNHDLGMLANGPYPHFLKTRVRSRLGHLSNEEGAELLGELCHEGLATVVLGHLSETNNDPNLALKAAKRVLESKGAAPATLIAAEQSRATMVFEI
jgi:phosphoribosyl 1,2-cyclic phosphodiesterase